MKWKKIIPDLISILFILLWVYAAVSKLVDYQKFQVQLGKSPMFTQFSNVMAWLVPAVELTISFMLFISSLRLIALYASFSLMVMFTAYIYIITRFSDHVPCSCGGILQDMSWDQHLLFNIGFVVLAFAGIMLHTNDEAQAVQSKYLRSA